MGGTLVGVLGTEYWSVSSGPMLHVLQEWAVLLPLDCLTTIQTTIHIGIHMLLVRHQLALPVMLV